MNYSYIFYRFDVIKMQIKHSSIIILLSGLAISPSVHSCKLYCLYIVVIAVHVLCIKTQLSLSTNIRPDLYSLEADKFYSKS